MSLPATARPQLAAQKRSDPHSIGGSGERAILDFRGPRSLWMRPASRSGHACTDRVGVPPASADRESVISERRHVRRARNSRAVDQRRDCEPFCAHPCIGPWATQATPRLQSPTDTNSPPRRFRTGIAHRQLWDNQAGIGSGGATGGPSISRAFYPGINDTLGADPNGIPFNPASMTLYSAWQPSRAASRLYARRARGNWPVNSYSTARP